LADGTGTYVNTSLLAGAGRQIVRKRGLGYNIKKTSGKGIKTKWVEKQKNRTSAEAIKKLSKT
jgi:hypothetical protein